MTINEAIVYEKYKDDLETALKYRLGVPINFKKITREDAIHKNIVIPAKEVQEIYDNLNKGKTINYSLGSLLRKNPDLICMIDSPTEAQQLYSLCCAGLSKRSVYQIMQHIKEPSKAVKYTALCCCSDNLRSEWHEWLDGFKEEELVKILTYNHNVARIMLPEQWTGRLAEEYLRVMVKTNRGDIIDDYLRRVKIPDALRDKVFYQAYCMVNGYNYTKIPKDFISLKLIQYTIDNSTSFVGILWMYESIPEKFKTYEISLQCCIKHFGCVSHLPDNLKNDEFYKTLMQEGQYYFINELDMGTVSDEVLEELITYYKPHMCIPQIPKKRITKKIALLLAQSGHIKSIPKSLADEEIYSAYVAATGDFKDVPEEYITEDLCIQGMKVNSRAALLTMPDQLKTDSFWEKVFQNKAYPSYDMIPEQYKSEELIKQLVSNTDYHFPVKEIPDNLLDEDGVVALMDKRPNMASNILMKWNQYAKAWDKLLEQGHLSSVYYAAKTLGEAPAHIIEELVKKYSDTILLRGLSKKQIETSIQCFPENILYATKEESDQAIGLNMDMGNVKFKQLSIWDILSA